MDGALCAALELWAAPFFGKSPNDSALVGRCAIVRPARSLARCRLARWVERADRCVEDAALTDTLPLDDAPGRSDEATVRSGRVTGLPAMPSANAVTTARHATATPAPSATRGGTQTLSRADRHPIASALRTRRRFVRRSRGSTGSSVSQTEPSAGSGSRTVGTATRCGSRRRRGVTSATSSLSLGGFNVPIPPLADIPHAC